MTKYTNNSNIPLSVAVFLATDKYDYNNATISATTLLRPLRQIVLEGRLDKTEVSGDLSAMIASRIGSAIHDGIEQAWKWNHIPAMLAMGMNKNVVNRVVVNPDPDFVDADIIPVYLEVRSEKQVGKHVVSGKFDFVGDGRVEDFKTTSVYTAMFNTNDTKYVWQGSIYRWLNPKIITSDQMAIQFLFTDWSAAKARSEKNYPQSRHQERVFNLNSVEETQKFVENKLNLIDTYWDTSEPELPYCTDEDLWRSEPVYKYYKNPEKMGRSTKNFDNLADANLLRATVGVGVVVKRDGQVNACKYCPAFHICSQKDELIAQGLLEI